MTRLAIVLTVLMIGLLGMIGLGSLAQQSEQQALARTQAIALAQDMVSRIRHNAAAVPYRIFETILQPNSAQPPRLTKSCQRERCSYDELAVYDTQRWGQLVATVLSGGRGWITQNQNQIDVHVQWPMKSGTDQVTVHIEL